MHLTGCDQLNAVVDGVELPIISPWSDTNNVLSCKREMGGRWIYLGSFSDENFIFIDFVSLQGFSKIARWRVSREGVYLDQSQFGSSEIGVLNRFDGYSHKNLPGIISEIAKKYANDFQIYSAIRYLLRDPEAAVAYINSYKPDHDKKRMRIRTDKSSSTHITVIFNHNYARNVPHLHEIYSERFSFISHVLPNVAPDSPHCFAFPAGSYSYHYLIYCAIMKIIHETDTSTDNWFLFVQDDVYLNRRFSEDNIDDFIRGGDNASAAFYGDSVQKRYLDYQNGWAWNMRIKNSINRQRDVTVGNGFEGFNAFFDEKHLMFAVGDIFAVRGRYLKEFAEILGNFIGQNIFPEVSIVTALKSLAIITNTRTAQFGGQYLWNNDRTKVNTNYLNEFDKTNDLFVHPVKIAQMGVSKT